MKMSVENQSIIEKLDLLGCIQCGRCTGGCPVTVRTNLNVRRFVYDAYQASLEDLMEELAQYSEIWDCTGCHTCAVRCPKGLKPVEVLYSLRNQIVESGKVEPTVRDALESVFLEGNPWGKPKATRFDWMEGLEVKTAEEGQEVEYLFYVCCSVAYDPKLQVVAQNMVKILEKAGVDYAFLGEEESCCGSEVQALGEEELFMEVQEENVELFSSYPAKKIVTLSPHCLSALKKYEGLEAEVIHYTQLLAELIDEGKLSWEGEFPKKVVYHDPCYLGKQNEVYDEPRQVLKSVPGIELTEFDRSRERSLCCEGGGGKMWVETESQQERLAETRARNAKELEAQVIVCACPFCILTLDDAVKAVGYEEEMEVMEITEILGKVL